LRGSTFTITSAGKLGGLLVTPLVNYPEVGILGIHRIAERPVARDGEVVVRAIGNVSLTFDHRVVDGARAAAFCLGVIERLQH
jgi:pyruvate dehydrogenase E2 component (dihydrolipoamide acetyltransferase)